MKNAFQPPLIGCVMLTILLFGMYLYLYLHFKFYYYIVQLFKIKVIVISYYFIYLYNLYIEFYNLEFSNVPKIIND